MLALFNIYFYIQIVSFLLSLKEECGAPVLLMNVCYLTFCQHRDPVANDSFIALTVYSKLSYVFSPLADAHTSAVFSSDCWSISI